MQTFWAIPNKQKSKPTRFFPEFSISVSSIIRNPNFNFELFKTWQVKDIINLKTLYLVKRMRMASARFDRIFQFSLFLHDTFVLNIKSRRRKNRKSFSSIVATINHGSRIKINEKWSYNDTIFEVNDKILQNQRFFYLLSSQETLLNRQKIEKYIGRHYY